jgi:hypothetical protein
MKTVDLQVRPVIGGWRVGSRRCCGRHRHPCWRTAARERSGAGRFDTMNVFAEQCLRGTMSVMVPWARLTLRMPNPHVRNNEISTAGPPKKEGAALLALSLVGWGCLLHEREGHGDQPLRLGNRQSLRWLGCEGLGACIADHPIRRVADRDSARGVARALTCSLCYYLGCAASNFYGWGF